MSKSIKLNHYIDTMGLASTDMERYSGVDVNNAMTFIGLYEADCTNLPSTSYFYIITFRYGSARAVQFAIPITGNTLYTRYLYGTWSAWKSITFS